MSRITSPYKPLTFLAKLIFTFGDQYPHVMIMAYTESAITVTFFLSPNFFYNSEGPIRSEQLGILGLFSPDSATKRSSALVKCHRKRGWHEIWPLTFVHFFTFDMLTFDICTFLSNFCQWFCTFLSNFDKLWHFGNFGHFGPKSDILAILDILVKFYILTKFYILAKFDLLSNFDILATFWHFGLFDISAK